MLIVVGRTRSFHIDIISTDFFCGGGGRGGPENRKMKQSFNTFPRYLRKGTRFCMNELNFFDKSKKKNSFWLECQHF